MSFFFQPSQVRKTHKDIYQQTKILREKRCDLCPNKSVRADRYMGEGSKKPRIMIISPYPLLDDELEHIESLFPESMRVAYYAISRCRVNLSKFFKAPEPEVLECCHNYVEDEIAKRKPDVIVGMGQSVLRWFLPQGAIDAWRGRTIPCKVKGHTFWFCPTYDTNYIYARQKKSKKGNSLPTEYDSTFEFDIAHAIKQVRSNRFCSVIMDGYYDNIKVCKGNTREELDTLQKEFRKFQNFASLAIDIETQQKKPYDEGSRLLSCAIGTSRDTVSFLLDHPESKFVDEKMRMLQDFLLNVKGSLAAHNLIFELTWFFNYFNLDVVHKPRWEDTMGQAYLLDERRGALSLDDLVLQWYGFSLKKLSNINISNLLSEPVDRVLTYNALDTKYEHKLFMDQLDVLPKEMEFLYRHTVDYVKAIAVGASYGFYVDKKQLAYFDTYLQAEMKRLTEKAYSVPEVKELERQQGKPVNLNSPKQLVKIFRDLMGEERIKKTGTGGYSTDDEVLTKLAEKGNPLAESLSNFRSMSKMHSTFIKNVQKIEKGGILHPEYNTYVTSTGRLSSGNKTVNMQNFPKRSYKKIRNIFKAPKGHLIVAFDYGQIEARVLAMAACDEVWCESVRQGLDIHMKWAKKVAQKYPPAAGVQTFDELIGDAGKLKKFRSKIKNTWVFPAFYGSKAYSISKSLGIPTELMEELFAEFWNEYSTIHSWQKQQNRFANRRGYVQNLLGRRRRMPIGWNELINMPIQSLASDIVLNAMSRLSKKAWMLRKVQYQPRLNIHDDLTFILPIVTLSHDILFISREMTRVPFKFVNVPMAVEVEAGTHWGSLEEIITYTTEDFKEEEWNSNSKNYTQMQSHLEGLLRDQWDTICMPLKSVA